MLLPPAGDPPPEPNKLRARIAFALVAAAADPFINAGNPGTGAGAGADPFVNAGTDLLGAGVTFSNETDEGGRLVSNLRIPSLTPIPAVAFAPPPGISPENCITKPAPGGSPLVS